ncbi:MAG TPA: hypothetical protein VK474_12375 [Chthoniobacterales bacterium]|nr:hypothetical protein [Chthoniobacterales bacterium]
MKTLLFFLGVTALLFLSGCAPGDAGGYTPSQVAAQHGTFDPTPRYY